ncbi:MAG TPA: peptidylprolyl isomerase [Longimicrobium sp.]|nr:peptidylprolyl isomerase [Longimicrobium sp.]
MRIAFALLLTALAAPAALAQPGTPAQPQQGEEHWDGVVAVVGDTVLLRSDIMVALEQLRAQGQTVPTDPQEYGRFIRGLTDQLVNDLLLIEAARDAGEVVDPNDIERTVDQRIAETRARFPSEAAYIQALAEAGRTPENYRAELIRRFADETLINRFTSARKAQMAPPAVSEQEIREFFEANRAQLGTRPAAISFQQVLIRPEPGDSARAAALKTAETVLQELGKGGDFEVLARRYGTDATSERGGDLGWFRQGQMVREFDQAVFAMRPGQVSGIVRTEFGFHIIKLEKVRGPERQARHILIRATISQADTDRARQRADSVATAARAGASMPDLAAKYDTPDEVRFQRDVPMDRLPAEVSAAFQGAEVGTVVGPVAVAGGPTTAFAVARVTGRQTEGEYTLEDVRAQIVGRLREMKMDQRIVEELRRDMHVSVRL